MSAIGPGDWVECVDVSPSAPNLVFRNEDKRLVLGAVYRVSEVFVDARGKAVLLVGWERRSATRTHGFRCGFGAWRFRPIYRPKADFLESLMQPATPEKVTA